MYVVLIIWLMLLALFILPQLLYLLYLKKASSRQWCLKIDESYKPNVSIIIPFHNESKIIAYKLENLIKVNYPKEKMQIILVDDSSTDNSVDQINEFIRKHQEITDISVIRINEHLGKAHALNVGLKHSKNEIIIVSDADSFWSSDILLKALPYLADQKIGAVMGRQVLMASRSIITRGEEFYVNFANDIIRLGESKIHSSIIFVGGFAAYKRKCIEEFDPVIDDSGTALRIIQKGYKSIFVPEAIYYEMFPDSIKSKFSIKVRRGNQIVKLYMNCFKLLIKRKLLLPKRIVISGVFLYIFSPIIFMTLLILTLILLLSNLTLTLAFMLTLGSVLIVPSARTFLLEALQSYFVLTLALFECIIGRKFFTWETRSRPTPNITSLKEKKLV